MQDTDTHANYLRTSWSGGFGSFVKGLNAPQPLQQIQPWLWYYAVFGVHLFSLSLTIRHLLDQWSAVDVNSCLELKNQSNGY